MAVITISRQMGSGAEDIARQVCDILGYDYLDKVLMTRVAADVGLTESEIIDFSEENYKVKSFIERLIHPGPRYVGHVVSAERLVDGIKTLTLKQLNEIECINLTRAALRAAYRRDNLVIVGRGGQVILEGMPKALHVRIEAPIKDRVERVVEEHQVSPSEARERISQRDKATAQYLSHFYHIRWDNPAHYHMVVNTSMWTLNKAAHLIAEAAQLL